MMDERGFDNRVDEMVSVAAEFEDAPLERLVHYEDDLCAALNSLQHAYNRWLTGREPE